MNAQAETMKDIVEELVAVIRGGGDKGNVTPETVVKMGTVKRINTPLPAETPGKQGVLPLPAERGSGETAGVSKLIPLEKPEFRNF
jgi:hypothetical protein